MAQDNLANLQTSDTVAVIRFSIDGRNYCIAATIGFCEKTNPNSMHLMLNLIEFPECMPNGAEIPLWLTVHDAPKWVVR